MCKDELSFLGDTMTDLVLWDRNRRITFAGYFVVFNISVVNGLILMFLGRGRAFASSFMSWSRLIENNVFCNLEVHMQQNLVISGQTE